MKLLGPRCVRRLTMACVLATALAAGGLSIAWPDCARPILVTAGLTLLISIVIGRIAWLRFQHRLHELREAIASLGRGDQPTSLAHPRTDDFSRLADAVEQALACSAANLAKQEQLRKQLTRNEKLALIGEIAATVAHEVNNPLDGLQNCTRIIRRDIDNTDQTRRLLDLMDNGLHRIEIIMRRMLTLSREEPAQLTPQRIDELVHEAMAFVQPRLDRRSVQATVDLPDEPLFAQADRHQMVQALINLMINAADAMPAGGRLTVRARPGDHGRVILLDIVDTGTGIDPQHLPHLFEPFYTTKIQGKGTGLGLAVVARIIEAHNARIDVTSRFGEGTCFQLTLSSSMPATPTTECSLAKPPQSQLLQRLGPQHHQPLNRER